MVTTPDTVCVRDGAILSDFLYVKNCTCLLYTSLPYGVFHMFSHPLDGLMASGTGLILLGAGALCLALSVLFTEGSSLSLYEVS